MAFAWRCRRCKGPFSFRCAKCKKLRPYPPSGRCRCGGVNGTRVDAPMRGAADEKPWIGPCPQCGGPYDGERVSVYDGEIEGANIQPTKEGEAISMSDAIAGQDNDPDARLIATGSPGLDWVLGGGLPQGIALLLSSPPGGGKSTLIIETLRKLALLRHDCLYVCSEERTTQIGRRYARLGEFPPKMMVLHQTSFSDILEALQERRPKFAAVDSLHDLEGVKDDNEFKYSIGSSTSITLAAKALRKIANDSGCTIFLVAHVTKEGTIAGANTVRHAVDAKLYINGHQKLIDGDYNIVGPERTLRIDGKYRFGETGRKAYFRLETTGLHDMGPWHHSLPPWEVSSGNRITEESRD